MNKVEPLFPLSVYRDNLSYREIKSIFMKEIQDQVTHDDNPI